jgi:uncharacterized protein (TIGR00730 family)
MRRLCVFAGSSRGISPRYREAASGLARTLVQRRIGIVYGGGCVGLMGVLADAAMEAGGEVIGVIPTALVAQEVAHQRLTELRVVDSMHQRKALMAELSDGFIALPGGIGTLEELFETLTWLQLGIHKKPCGLLEVDEYWKRLLGFLDHAVQQQFLRPEHRAMLLADSEPSRLLDQLSQWSAPPIPKWLDLESS